LDDSSDNDLGPKLNESEYDPAKLKLAIRHGAMFGYLQSIISFLTVSAAILLDAGKNVSENGYAFAQYDDPLNYIDTVFLLVCASFLFARSRTAAVLLALNYLYSMYVGLFDMHRPGTLLAFPFLVFYARAIPATFRYRELVRGKKNPSKTPSLKFTLITTVIIISASVAVVYQYFRTTGPPSHVIPGSEVTPEDYKFLLTEGIIDPEEEIVWFYSGGVFSIEEDGNLVTDKRVISYQIFGEERWVAAAHFNQIKELEVIRRGSFFRGTLFTINTKDRATFEVLVSAKKNGDDVFITEIYRKKKEAENSNAVELKDSK